MATLFETSTTTQVRMFSTQWLGRMLMLIPEIILLPLLFGVYLLTNQLLIVAFIAELVFVWFVVRLGLMGLAQYAWHNGKYQRAQRLIRASLRLYPYSADAWALLSMIQVAKGELEPAIEAAKRAINLFPQYPHYQLTYSYALTANHQWIEARHVAMTALALDEHSALIHAQIARLSYLMNEAPSVAYQWVETGLSLKTDAHAQIELYLARAEAAIVAKQPRLANLALEQVQTQLPLCAVPIRAAALYRIGRIQQDLNNPDAARSAFERIETLDYEGGWLHAAWRAKVETKVA